jgi:hypothetical protein
VISTHAWRDRFPTTPTNRNRHRVYMLAKQFLATDVAALAARPIEDSTTFLVPVMEDPNCKVCHDTIDPIAAGWQNWDETNRFLRFRTGAGGPRVAGFVPQCQLSARCRRQPLLRRR